MCCLIFGSALQRKVQEGPFVTEHTASSLWMIHKGVGGSKGWMVEYKLNTSCSITKTSLTLCSDMICCMYAFTAATGAGIRNCSELRPFKHAFVQLKEPEGGYGSKLPLERLVTTWRTRVYLNDSKAKFLNVTNEIHNSGTPPILPLNDFWIWPCMDTQPICHLVKIQQQLWITVKTQKQDNFVLIGFDLIQWIPDMWWFKKRLFWGGKKLQIVGRNKLILYHQLIIH